MSQAETAIAADASAFYFNPAGLSRHSEYRLLSVSQRFVSELDNFGIQAAVIDSKTEDPLHWGFLFNFARDKLAARFQDYAFVTSYNYQNFILLGVGQRFSNFDQRTQTPDKWTYGLNAGLLLFATDNVALGFSVDNVYRNHSDKFTNPVILRTGVSANFQELRIGLDLERNQSKGKTFGRAGVEYQASRMVQVRTGAFCDTKKDDLGYSLGLGISPAEGFQLNFGWLDQLKSSMTLWATDLTFKF